MRCVVFILLVGCTADRTLSEQPPFRCTHENEHSWYFALDDESHCIVPHPAFYSCVVEVAHNYGTAEQTVADIPPCAAPGSTVPCWRADDAVARCSGLEIAIDRDEPPASGDAIFGFCATCD